MSTHNLVKSLRADRSQLASEVRQLRAEVERAKRALLSHGFTDCGGAEWKPPLGPHPGTLLAEVERHQQTIHTLECDIRDAHENRDKYRAEVERLRAEANARAVEELREVYRVGRHGAALWSDVVDHIRKRIAELSKPAAKESEPARCAERVWASGDMEACGKPLPCGDHTKPEEEPDWTVTLAAQANVASVRADKARLLTLIVEGLCNLGREVRRGGKS